MDIDQMDILAYISWILHQHPSHFCFTSSPFSREPVQMLWVKEPQWPTRPYPNAEVLYFSGIDWRSFREHLNIVLCLVQDAPEEIVEFEQLGTLNFFLGGRGRQLLLLPRN
jgi:hypothetical protein